MTRILDRTAPTDAPILDVLAERWSTRLFDASAALDEGALASALEAARWAPSANNSQPVRFIVARRGTAAHAALLDALTGFNRSWAADASALVAVLAETAGEDGTVRPWALYDAGQAAALLTVQAHADGLHTHQMGGFVADAIRGAFDLPANLRPVTVIAAGVLGDPASAPAALLERENAPRTRRPVAESLLVDA